MLIMAQALGLLEGQQGILQGHTGCAGKVGQVHGHAAQAVYLTQFVGPFVPAKQRHDLRRPNPRLWTENGKQVITHSRNQHLAAEGIAQLLGHQAEDKVAIACTKGRIGSGKIIDVDQHQH